MNALPLDQLKLETFAARLQIKFRVYLDDANFVELELVEANGTNTHDPAKPMAPFQESFSLIFNGPKNSPLLQNIYSFEQDGLGRFDLFIVPIGQKNGSFQYQAVFNRLIQPG
jgi:hypothetical protein